MKKYIIFDFDGTIANTNDVIVESWQAAFVKYIGHELPVRDVEATFGETIEYTIKTLLPGIEWTQVRDFFRSYQKNDCKAKVKHFPGVVDMLDELKARGYVLAVATSRTAKSYHDYMHRLGLEGYFDVEITMEDVSAHKPDPECIYAVLEKLGAKPEESIMIGDTKYDIGSAVNAGVDSVIVGWSHYIAPMEWTPTYTAEKPEDILKIVEA